jgi:chromosome partitioning protein
VDALIVSLLLFFMMADRARTAHVLTVLNLKGGVGKTHTSWVLAGVAEERNQRILLVDLDPQANLSKSFLDEVPLRESVAALFDPSAEPDALTLVHRTLFSHIDIIPASVALASFDESKQGEWERTDSHLVLRDAVATLRNHHDLIVFDCPPRLSLVSFAALCASDFVIVPLEAADWGAQGTQYVADAIAYVHERFNPQLRLLGYLISRYKPARSYQRTYMDGLRKHFGEAMFDTVLPDAAEFEKSVTDRIPVTRRAPQSSAAKIARDFADEVARRIAARTQGPKRLGTKPRPAVGATAR